jgi:apolipoprotein D and lipocalin family protein
MSKKIRRKFLLAAFLLLSVASQSGCLGVPDGVQTVSGFEVDRYLGTWYEIARLDHRFERGMTKVTATYSKRDDGGVNVINRGYKAAEGEWSEATGKAYFVGATDVGQLKVSFFGPFYGAYNIIELDKEHYQYALIVGPDRDYLWVLARTPALDENVLSSLVAKARSLNFPTDDLIYVSHAVTDRKTGSNRDYP